MNARNSRRRRRCGVGCVHRACQHIERTEERRCSMAFVFMTDATDSGSVGESQVPLRTLQRLNRWLLIHRDNHSVFRRIEIERYDIGGLADKLRVRADAPASGPLQLDLVLTQHAPHFVFGHVAKYLSHQPSVPARVTLRRRLIERFQDPLGGIAILWLCTGPRGILQADKTQKRESQTPLADRARPLAELARDRRRTQPRSRRKNDSGSTRIALFYRRTLQPTLQRRAILRGKMDFSGLSHAAHYIINYHN